MGRTAKTTAPVAKHKPGQLIGSKNTVRIVAKTAPKAVGKETPKRKPGRPLGSRNISKALSRPTSKTTVKAAPKVTRQDAVSKAAAAVPKLRQEELRDQVEKLEYSIATLRNRLMRDVKANIVRIEELEDRMAQFEDDAATVKPAPVVQKAMPARSARGKRQSRDIDPGDAVPPGVKVAEPALPDDEAETVLENLRSRLRQK